MGRGSSNGRPGAGGGGGMKFTDQNAFFWRGT